MINFYLSNFIYFSIEIVASYFTTFSFIFVTPNSSRVHQNFFNGLGVKNVTDRQTKSCFFIYNTMKK